ncbi:MAG: hypothetical protein ABW221_00805 [Vicinamibacteria bacterium]
MRWPRIARWTSVLAVAAASLGSAALASAHGTDPFRQIRLVRAANDDIRIEWRAAVYETGGEFLVSRGAPAGPRRLVARVAPGPRVRYRVSDAAEPGAWVYELRYRDARGRERILATIELNLDELERGTAAAVSRPGLGSVAVQTDAAGPWTAPAPFPIAVTADDGLPVALRGRPPTPPPRANT